MTLILGMHACACMKDLVMFCIIKNDLCLSHLLHILLILFDLFRYVDKQGVPRSDESSLICVHSVCHKTTVTFYQTTKADAFSDLRFKG